MSPLVVANRLRRWVAEDWLRRVAKNAGMVLAGNGAATVFTALALVLSARGLSPEDFGRLSLIAAYVAVADGLLNFQSWQALIRYGAEARSRNDRDSLQLLLGFGVRLDLLHAVGGSALACAGAFVIAELMNWPSGVLPLVLAYSATILFRLTGTPIAVLRLFDRFTLIAIHTALLSVLRVVFVTLAYFWDGQLLHFVLAWAAADVGGSVMLVLFARRAVRQEGLRLANVATTAAVLAFPGLKSFVWTTNLHSAMKLAIKEGDVLIVGAVAGAAAAGVYRIAKQISGATGKAVGPLYQSIYPELAAAVAQQSAMTFRKMIYRPGLLAAAAFGMLCALFAWLGQWGIEVLFGDAYQDVYWPALIYLIGTAMSVAGFAMHPALLALGAPAKSLSVLTGSTLIYLPTLVAATHSWGAIGAAGAYVVFYAIWSSLMAATLVHEWRRFRDSPVRTQHLLGEST